MKKTVDKLITLRPRRQLTLPRDVCDKLGITSGDVLEISVEGQTIIAKPQKARSLDALKAIQAAFQKSNLSELELLESGRQSRGRITRKKYGRKL